MWWDIADPIAIRDSSCFSNDHTGSCVSSSSLVCGVSTVAQGTHDANGPYFAPDFFFFPPSPIDGENNAAHVTGIGHNIEKLAMVNDAHMIVLGRPPGSILIPR